MNSKGFFLLLFFCLYSEITNISVIKTQFSYNLKYCLEDDSSFIGIINKGIESLCSIGYNLNEIVDAFSFNKYDNYNDRESARKEREIKFRQAYPDFELKNYAKDHGLRCVLYDKRINILDDSSILEIPYNFRPLYYRN